MSHGKSMYCLKALRQEFLPNADGNRELDLQ